MARLLININTGLADLVHNIALFIGIIADSVLGKAGHKMITRNIEDKYKEHFSNSEKEKYDKLYHEMKKREKDE